MKKVAIENLEVGKKYYVECGIWYGYAVYVGSVPVGSRLKYRFTYGSIENWEHQFGHLVSKSNIKVYEYSCIDENRS